MTTEEHFLDWDNLPPNHDQLHIAEGVDAWFTVRPDGRAICDELHIIRPNGITDGDLRDIRPIRLENLYMQICQKLGLEP